MELESTNEIKAGSNTDWGFVIIFFLFFIILVIHGRQVLVFRELDEKLGAIAEKTSYENVAGKLVYYSTKDATHGETKHTALEVEGKIIMIDGKLVDPPVELPAPK